MKPILPTSKQPNPNGRYCGNCPCKLNLAGLMFSCSMFREKLNNFETNPDGKKHIVRLDVCYDTLGE